MILYMILSSIALWINELGTPFQTGKTVLTSLVLLLVLVL